MSGKKSRTKGARGERELAKELNKWLLPDGTPVHAERNARNGISTADLAHNIPGYHFEAKWNEKMLVGGAALEAAMNQAEQEAERDGCFPVVAFKRNRIPWVVAYREMVGGEHTGTVAVSLDYFMRTIGCTRKD